MIVLVSATADPVSGWGVLTYHYAHALWKKSIPFILLLPRRARVPDAPFASACLRVLPDLPLTFSGPLAWLAAHRLWRGIPYVPPRGSVIHSLVDFPYAVLARNLARAHRLPLMINAIGTYSVAPFHRLIDRHLYMPAYRGAERIVAISRYTASAMREAARKPRRIDIAYLPVERPAPQGQEDRSILDELPPNKRYILTVASPRIGDRKGFDILREAFERALPRIPDAHLVAVGGAARKKEPSCTVLPPVSAAELAALFSACALFAATPRRSGDYFEGYGLVYREAGLYGKPVVGTETGGVPEAVEHGVTGLLVPENDSHAAAEALVRVMTDANLAERLGAAGRAAASAWTWGLYADRMLELYAAMRRQIPAPAA